MRKDAALSAFERAVNSTEFEANLARAALLLGKFEYPELDIDAYEARLDRMAGAAAARANGDPAELARFLFAELGFAGNAFDYHDPRNSFLNDVIERQLGIPITLSVLFLEVARRLGIPADGVGLPGHFIVRARTNARTGDVFLDPFHNGAQLSEADCRERVRSITDGKLPFSPDFLAPVDAHYILTRILNNLKNAYAQRGDLQRSLAVVERLLVLHPNLQAELRNRGLLLAGLGRKREAAQAFEHYLEKYPDTSESKTIRQYLDQLAGDVARWN